MPFMRVLTTALLLLMFAGSALAEETLKVGIKPSEPWVMYDTKQPEQQRQPRGFSIDLWNAIASDLGVKTQWVYFDKVSDLIDAAHNNRIDAGISAITVTSQREEQVDFSNSMYELGLRILVPADASPNPWLVAAEEIGKFFTWKVLLILTILITIFAHIRWLVDRRFSDSSASFPADYRHGIREAAWWALTMFITWDTPPRQGAARVIDLTWFLTGFLCLGILSSVITAALTEQNLDNNIQSVRDLLDKRVAAVASDAPREYLLKQGINVIPVNNLDEGIQKVLKGEADALVHDGPRLIYLAQQHNKTPRTKQVNVLPVAFNPQIYGIAFPTNSTWVEPVNHSLMKLREAQGVSESIHESLRKKWLQN
jgi:ABC-type amino acid transport substrate-binding protein